MGFYEYVAVTSGYQFQTQGDIPGACHVYTACTNNNNYYYYYYDYYYYY